MQLSYSCFTSSIVRFKKILMFLFFFLVFSIYLLSNQVQAEGGLSIDGSTSSNIFYQLGDGPVIIDSDITISGIEYISSAKVQITSNFTSSEDQLLFTNQNGISGSYDSNKGILTLSGSATTEEYEIALRSVKYNNTNSSKSINKNSRAFVFSLGGNTLYNSNTGHFYEYVPAQGITWHNAKASAENRSLYGMQGYLATITSADENNFIKSKLSGMGWIGASDAAVEGQWRWVTGPEAGTLFTYKRKVWYRYWSRWYYYYSTDHFGYQNWNGGEPNDWGSNGEDYGHLYTSGKWNDFHHHNGSIQGYVVEYGGMQGDNEVKLIHETSITIETDEIAPETNAKYDHDQDGANNWFISPVTLTLEATDVYTGVASTEYSLDGVSWLQYNSPIQLIEDGIYTVYYRSIDNAGNVESIKSVTVRIDTTAPNSNADTTGTHGANGWYISEATLSLSATDDGSGMAKVEYKINDGDWEQYTDSISLPDGMYSIDYRSIDYAGNVEGINSVTINVDTTAPKSNANTTGTHGANGWYISETTLSLSATDDGSGIAKVEYRINEGNWEQYTDSILLPDGMYSIDYRSIDNAGNVEDIKTLIVNVDTTAPDLTVELDKYTLWSPNHKMVEITATLDYSDETSQIAIIELVSITSNEADNGQGDGNTEDDIQEADFGTDDRVFKLRSERSGKGKGRIYTITYKVSDFAGNETIVQKEVVVAHNKGKKGK